MIAKRFVFIHSYFDCKLALQKRRLTIFPRVCRLTFHIKVFQRLSVFSIKMRSSLGGKNGVGGKHIYGAERIVEDRDVEKTEAALLERARCALLEHGRFRQGQV